MDQPKKRILKNSKKSNLNAEEKEENSIDSGLISLVNKKPESSLKDFQLYFHQKYAVLKNIEIISRGDPYIEGVMGQLPRMGKSHIMLGTILEYLKTKEYSNVLILSTAPNDSLPPLLEDLNKYKDFEDFYFERIEEDMDEKDFNEKMKKKNIFLASKQFLQYRIEKENILPLPTIDLLFTDEIHNGGCTDLSNDIFKIYGSNAHKFYVSGTYGSAMDYFRIPIENLNLFDLESIALCKKITKREYQVKLIEKHGPLMKKCIDEEPNLGKVEEFFNRLPSLVLHSVNLTEEMLDSLNDFNRNNDTNYGLSLKAFFELNDDKDEFQNSENLIQLCKGIFPIDSENKTIIDNIIAKNRTINLRGFQLEYPSIIMCFLPFGRGQKINDVSKCFQKLFFDNHINDDFDILILNDSESTSDKTSLDKINKKYNSIIGKKKGLLVLSGKKCMMGISIPRCDVVILFNTWSELNPIFQSMYRCMTDDYDEPMKTNKPQFVKKYGHVIDVNFHRQIQLIVDYSSNIFSGMTTQDAIKMAFDLNLFEIEQESWHNTVFEEDEIGFEELSDKIYQSWFEFADSKRVNNIIEDRFLDNINLNNDIINFMNGADVNINNQSLSNSIDIDLHRDHSNVKKGYKPKNDEDKQVGGGGKKLKEELEEIDYEKEWKELQKFKDFLNHIIFLVIILTIYEPSMNQFKNMFEFIQSRPLLKTIFYQKIKDWFKYDNIHIQQNQLDFNESMFKLFNLYFPNGHLLHKNIKLMKELFCSNLKNPKILHRMIQQYITNTELEIKNFGNVSTPNEIVNHIVDKVPDSYWKFERKMYEPCCGKGTFILKVIEKMMTHLNKKFESDELKYKYIIENCIYYSDSDLLNIYITNVLLRKNINEIKLNYHCGNSLNFNPFEFSKWNIQKRFDIIFMNPPFTDGSGARGANHKLWEHFVRKSIHEWLMPNGLLGTMHPSGWRHIEGICGDLLKSRQMIYLKIFNEKQGKKIFNCNVRFDLYLLINLPNIRPTEIIDENGKKLYLEIRNQLFIPSKNIEYIYSLVAKDNEPTFQIIYDRSMYGSDKKNMSNKETDVFKYPCVYSIKVNDEPKFYYSNERKGHFGIPKLIFGSGATGFLKDKNGEFGLTNYAKGIIETPENIDNLYIFMKSDKFENIKESLYITMNEINFQVLRLFRKDFWKK